MASEPQGNPGKPRLGPSDRLIDMFRLALQSRSIAHVILCMYGTSELKESNNFNSCSKALLKLLCGTLITILIHLIQGLLQRSN